MNRALTSDKIIFDAPAAQWHDAFPIGNGRLGGMVFGSFANEKISINEDTLWCGEPETSDNIEKLDDSTEWTKVVTALARKRKYVAAHDRAMKALSGGADVRPYSFFGNLLIDIVPSEGKGETVHTSRLEYTGYSRCLDMSTATVTTECCLNGNRVVRRCYASCPDDAIIYEISSDRPVDVKIDFEGGCLSKVKPTDSFITAIGHCYSNDPSEPGNAVRYAGVSGIYTDDDDESHAEVSGVTHAMIVFRAASNYRAIMEACGRSSLEERAGRDYSRVLSDDELLSLCKITKPDKSIYDRHLDEFRQFYDRVRLTLSEENTIYTTLFNFGRYLMISASRPGCEAANLQGIWNNLLTPPWSSNYTLNINTEMNYWLTGPCDLHEMAEPLLRLAEKLCEGGRHTAKNFFAAEGTCSFHNSNLWGKTAVAWGSPMWNCWYLGSQWLCRNLFEECLFSGDYEYMIRTEKVMRENIKFCFDMSTETDRGIALCPGTSPENEFWWRDDSPEIALTGTHVNHPKTWDDWMAPSDDGCRKVAVGVYSENANAIFRNLCRDYIELCERLDCSDRNGHYCDNAEYIRAKDILPRIVPVRLDSKGRIMEWNEEMPECDVHHRHLSHLYELHPGRGITSEDAELFEAVRNSLLSRGDEGTGWSLAWKLLMWARMKDGSHEEGLLKMFIRHVEAGPNPYMGGGGIYRNLFCAHPPFQIDGNFGFSAAVAEMLVQSHEDYIHILPALPPSWNRGSVTGLRCRGQISVNISWEDGRVSVNFEPKTYPDGRAIRYRIGDGEITE